MKPKEKFRTTTTTCHSLILSAVIFLSLSLTYQNYGNKYNFFPLPKWPIGLLDLLKKGPILGTRKVQKYTNACSVYFLSIITIYYI